MLCKFIHSFRNWFLIRFINTEKFAFAWPNVGLASPLIMSDFLFFRSSMWLVNFLGDLKTRKSTGTSCQIEILFSSQTSKFLIKYNLLWFQISGGLLIFFTEHDYKVSTSFIKENKSDQKQQNRLPGLLLMVQSAGCLSGPHIAEAL